MFENCSENVFENYLEHFFENFLTDVAIVKDIPSGLPKFNIPVIDTVLIRQLFPIAATLVMVGVGILAVLLAWAYYLYKKPHRLVSLSEIEQKVLINEERLIKNERRLPSEEEINTSTTSNILQSKINEKDLEISELKEQINKTNTNDQKLKEELEIEKKKAEKDKLDLQKKLMEKIFGKT